MGEAVGVRKHPGGWDFRVLKINQKEICFKSNYMLLIVTIAYA